jgi:hypothetical protein
LLKIDGWYVVEDIREEFEEEWRSIGEALNDSYDYFLYNMNNISKNNGKDNIALAVKRIS